MHYQPGAADDARTVAALLPAAVARVEAVLGRRFARPAAIGVYASDDAFAAASAGSRAAAVTLLGHVVLSPALFAGERARLAAILTHELSHAHLQGAMPGLTFYRLPNWFKEGLGVMVSDGGGAERVTEAEAGEAIARGERIVIDGEGSWLNLSRVRFQGPAGSGQMAYRQAGMFVSFIRDRDPAGFARMMDAILDGRPFAEAVETGFGVDPPELWTASVRGRGSRGGTPRGLPSKDLRP